MSKDRPKGSIFIIGICGTFMGSLALLARDLGYAVSGSDKQSYPPMGPMLQEAGMAVFSDTDLAPLEAKPDLVIIGNSASRGHPQIEYVLDAALPYTSGPEWLYQALLRHKWVLAVAGTHGKTTTTSILTWILEYAGLNPSFLIGGRPQNFAMSSRLTDSKYFVIEADEYDTAFFDKRSKFVHYHPRTLILNNLEFDHADIFDTLADIEKSFHHLVRTVPPSGTIIHNKTDEALLRVLNKGCWSQEVGFLGPENSWQYELISEDGSQFKIVTPTGSRAEVAWNMLGRHNIENAIAAAAAAATIGVSLFTTADALAKFIPPKRRLECRGVVGEVSVYDDFAHHPTAIALTVQALRARVRNDAIIAVVDIRSNTMRMGIHETTLAHSLHAADMVLLYADSNLTWDITTVTHALPAAKAFTDIESLLAHLLTLAQPRAHVLFMSNGSFGGVIDRFLQEAATTPVAY